MQPEVVEKEQRLSTLNDEVIDVHGHAVDSDCVEYSEVGGQFDLGSDTVGAGNQDRIFIVPLENFLIEIQPKHPGKGAVLAHDPLAVGSTNRGLDEFHEPIAGIDIDT